MSGVRKQACAITLSILVLWGVTSIVTKFSAQSEMAVPALASNIIRIEYVNDKKTRRQNQIPELPNIDAVDVLEAGYFPSKSGDLITSSRTVTLKGELAQQVAHLWRQLIPGDSARCHTPAFGLRFYFKEKSVLQASMCWHCNNMYLWEKSSKSLYGVDMDQPSAQKLFSLLEKIMK
ncbi:hypothetical protein [Microcoleus sp. Pol17_C1]|uniref:hypothetical protein n=1 Tax=unclassified Microcoleus TaxID=2642155 RepID=UPI002FCFEE74